MTYYYDGREIDHVTRGITGAPMYIVIVNTISGKYPYVSRADSMQVAYVRVWKKAPRAH